MAGGRIKGITVEIGGDTTGLDKSLKGVNSTIKTTQSSLKDVNKLLKLDPANTNLVTQKQKLLKDAVNATKEKLEALKTAQEQARQQLENGTLGQDKYDALQREIIETEEELRRLQQEAETTSSVGMLVNATHLVSRKNTLKLILKNTSAMIIPVLKTGLPLSITQFGMALTTQIFNNRIIQVGGENYVSAYSVITQLSMTAMAFYDGTGQAAQPIIAANYGAKNQARISQTIRKGICLEIVLTVLCTLFYILASKGICGLFSIRKGELLSVTTGAIRIYALAVPFTGLNTFIMYTFQSQEKTTIATVLSLISSCAMMLIALFTLTAVFGSAGIWYTWVVAQVLSLFVSFSFYHFYTENRLDGGNITT